MKFVFCTLIFLSLGFASSSCSRGSGGANANQGSGEQGPQYTDANQALTDGTALLDEGETDRAIDVLNQAVKLNPDLAEAYFRLGIAYGLVEARDASIVEDERECGNARTRRRGKKLNSVIAFEHAIDGYKKIVTGNKGDHTAWFNLGRSYNKLNKDNDALEAFREAVSLNPEDTEYQTALGAILIKLARYREAVAPLKKALEIDPENVEAQEFLEDAEGRPKPRKLYRHAETE
jgi:tetratricopeptide (TPR) repeat protein